MIPEKQDRMILLELLSELNDLMEESEELKIQSNILKEKAESIVKTVSDKWPSDVRSWAEKVINDEDSNDENSKDQRGT